MEIYNPFSIKLIKQNSYPIFWSHKIGKKTTCLIKRLIVNIDDHNNHILIPFENLLYKCN